MWGCEQGRLGEWGRKRGENGGRSDTNKWQRYGQFWSRFDKVVWGKGCVEVVKNGGRHAPCRGICCYSEEHYGGKRNHDDRDQRRRLQGVSKVVEIYPFAESWLCQ
ncbi:hypothetical protein F0562_001388 [Nyssa sinensis]|uniref:Uncharacterized protein n=1 Tax=Nyssa sinensis TaxID=561372 RepID=A0A5J5C454_9ASTE|nr:hypothetical protein F0562_001388 [Nyssa sinensis]